MEAGLPDRGRLNYRKHPVPLAGLRRGTDTLAWIYWNKVAIQSPVKQHLEPAQDVYGRLGRAGRRNAVDHFDKLATGDRCNWLSEKVLNCVMTKKAGANIAPRAQVGPEVSLDVEVCQFFVS